MKFTKGDLTLIFATIGVFISVVVMMHLVLQEDMHSCDSPCTVVFPPHTQEDDFTIDYSHATLRVTKKKAGHP